MNCTRIARFAGGASRKPAVIGLLLALACSVIPATGLAQAAVPAEAAASAAVNLAGMEFGVREMFIQAHIVVKAVIVFLALCSAATWMILIEKSIAFSLARRANARFIEDFRRSAAAGELPSADESSAMGRMWTAARAEQERFKAGPVSPSSGHDQDRMLQRLALQAGIVQDQELARLGTMMGVLATIGSTSPFTGLFGTVWGILNSFAHIAVARSTSLTVVAPGIAEALLATAIGLFAAIPAVIIYNKFVRDINGFVSTLDNFSAELITVVSRRLDGSDAP